jgi:hypothetical protein
MSNSSELQTRLAQQVSTCGWNIVKIIVIGIVAGGVALFGQHSLSGARPIFPFIEQNFGLWQSAYVVIELVIGLVWAAAVLQKINLFQEAMRRLRMQAQLEEKKEERAQKMLAVKRAEAAQAKKNVSKTARSAKFDY